MAFRSVNQERGAFKTLGFIALTAVLTLGTVALISEGLLRIVGWRAPGFYDDSGTPVSNRPPDREGGAFKGPRSGVYTHFDFEVKWRVNEYGFRERPFEPKAPDIWRIGFFGDSFTAGYGVERNQRFPDIWARRLDRKIADLEIWNFGSNNAGTHHLADVLEGVAAQYELDEIVLVIYSGNELTDNLAWARKNEAARKNVRPAQTRGLGRRFLRDNSRLALFLWFQGAARISHLMERTDAPAIDFFDPLWPETSIALDRFVSAVASRPLTV